MSIKVSIIICCHNNASFVAEVLDSCLAQTMPAEELEIIFVDDGSTDRSLEIARAYQPRVNVLHKANGGQASAFNLGFTQARGEYLLLCDADDYLRPRRAERIAQEFEQYPNLALALNGRTILQDDTQITYPYPEFQNLRLNRQNLGEIRQAAFGTSRTAVRRSTLSQILPLPEVDRMGADIVIMELLWLGTISAISEPLTVYRVHQQNLFHTATPEKQFGREQTLERNLNQLKTRIQRHDTYDSQIAEGYLIDFETMLLEARVGRKLSLGQPLRLDLLKAEIKQLERHASEWSCQYQLYKILRLPMLLAFPRWFRSQVRGRD